MEQRLREALICGEEVRWTGRPSPFKLMDCPERRSIFLTWLLSALVLLGALLYIAAVQHSGADWLIVAVVAAFLPVMLSVRPLLDKLCLEKNTLYAITNLRVIALVKDDVMYLPLGRGMRVAVEHQDHDCGNLCFGDAVGREGRKSRSDAVLGIRSEGNQPHMLGMLFYHIRCPESLLPYFASSGA